MKMSQKFLYFGYGSNMLAKRIHIQNPTAVRVGGGRLQNYRLDFHTHSKNWHGAPATVVPSEGAHVFGAIWEIDLCNMKDLDDQEGVGQCIYIPVSLPVLCLGANKIVCCRAYHLVKQPVEDLRKIPKDVVPYERQPSKTYLKTLVKGALETGIEANYVEWLRSLRHNEKVVDELEEKLELQNVHIS